MLNYVSSGAKLSAAVAFHPGGSFIRPTNGTKITTPTLVLAGALDIRAADFQNNIAQVLINASATFELQRFGQTRHAFTRWDTSNNTQYSASTDERSWSAAKSFVDMQFFSTPQNVAQEQRCGESAKLMPSDDGCCELCKTPEPVSCVLPDCPNNVEPVLVDGNPCPGIVIFEEKDLIVLFLTFLVCANVNCIYADCTDPACGEHHDAIVPVGSCCATCVLNCTKAQCPTLQCAANEVYF